MYGLTTILLVSDLKLSEEKGSIFYVKQLNLDF